MLDLAFPRMLAIVSQFSRKRHSRLLEANAFAFCCKALLHKPPLSELLPMFKRSLQETVLGY